MSRMVLLMTAGRFMGPLSLYWRVEPIASPTTAAGKGPLIVDDCRLNRKGFFFWVFSRLDASTHYSHSENLLKRIFPQDGFFFSRGPTNSSTCIIWGRQILYLQEHWFWSFEAENTIKETFPDVRLHVGSTDQSNNIYSLMQSAEGTKGPPWTWPLCEENQRRKRVTLSIYRIPKQL